MDLTLLSYLMHRWLRFQSRPPENHPTHQPVPTVRHRMDHESQSHTDLAHWILINQSSVKCPKPASVSSLSPRPTSLTRLTSPPSPILILPSRIFISTRNVSFQPPCSINQSGLPRITANTHVTPLYVKSEPRTNAHRPSLHVASPNFNCAVSTLSITRVKSLTSSIFTTFT